MNEANVGLVWRVLCGVAAVYMLFWEKQYVAAAVFALAAK
jgi:hypothetical protein